MARRGGRKRNARSRRPDQAVPDPKNARGPNPSTAPDRHHPTPTPPAPEAASAVGGPVALTPSPVVDAVAVACRAGDSVASAPSPVVEVVGVAGRKRGSVASPPSPVLPPVGPLAADLVEPSEPARLTQRAGSGLEDLGTGLVRVLTAHRRTEEGVDGCPHVAGP